MAGDEPSEHELMAELESLRARITASQAQVRDADFKSLCVGTGSSLPGLRLKGRKILKGHIAKVVAVDFAGDSKHAVSASLDGKLIIWDTWSGNKVRIIPVRTTWIMGAAFESSGRFVAVGGMDNMCTIYDLEKKWGGNHEGGVLGAALVRELAGLQGYLSCCVFVNQEKIVVGSADTKVYVFDIPSGKKVQEYTAHEADVIGLSIQPTDSNVFVTASMDKTCKLFDLRSNDLCRQTFEGHDADVNDVSFQTNGHVFTSCSEDGTCKLFDIRSDVEMASYRDPAKGTAFTCVANSKSGRLILAGSDDDTVHIWDVLAPPNLDESHLGNLWGHDARVSSMAMSPNGVATITASWDTSVRIWA